jgi:hypothetical protein
MDRRPSDRVLEEWDSVTRNAQRPAESPRRRGAGSSLGFLTLVPLAAIALVIAVGLTRLGATETNSSGASASPGASTVAVVPSPAPSTGPTIAPTIGPSTPPTAAPTPSESTGTCTLEAAIKSWEGAAGSRIATIELRNSGDGSCAIAPIALAARLVDGSGRVLAQVENADNGARIELGPGESAMTDASATNVCVDAPPPPITIELDLGDGGGSVKAQPLDPTDATVPPCNGPTQPSVLSIHPWSR